MSKKQLVNILIVDDFSNMRRMLLGMLKRAGFKNIIEMPSADSALKVVDAANSSGAKIDLVISDWSMPEKTGYEFLCALRKIPGYEKVPFIMLTSSADVEYIQMAAKAGVDGYVLKPFSPAMLEEKVCSALKIPLNDKLGSEL